MDLTSLKQQLSIDGDENDTYLTDLINQAQEYIIAGVDSSQSLETYQQYKVFDRAVAMLVAEWFFNRMATSDLNLKEIPNGVKSIQAILQGKMLGGDDDSTTGS